MRRSLLTTLLLPLLAFTAACGDEATEDPNAITCDASQRIKTLGGVGDVPGDFTATNTLGGLLTPRRIALSLGEVTFTPQGASEPVTRPRTLTFQTNTADPQGRELLEILGRRKDAGDDGLTFQIVNQPDGTFCDANSGQLCARLGLEDTPNLDLTDDNIIHTAITGSLSFSNVSSTRLAASWEIDLGPNIINEFDTSEGSLRGCFDANIGPGAGENTYPLQ